MLVHRMDTDIQSLGDLPVGDSISHRVEHRQLRTGEAVRVLSQCSHSIVGELISFQPLLCVKVPYYRQDPIRLIGDNACFTRAPAVECCAFKSLVLNPASAEGFSNALQSRLRDIRGKQISNGLTDEVLF